MSLNDKLALMGHLPAPSRSPDDFQPLGEQFGRFSNDARTLYSFVVAAPREIDPAARQQVERRPFLGDMQRWCTGRSVTRAPTGASVRRELRQMASGER